jgi:hypothetical protein
MHQSSLVSRWSSRYNCTRYRQRQNSVKVHGCMWHDVLSAGETTKCYYSFRTFETTLPVNRSRSATPCSVGESPSAAAAQLYPTMAWPRLCGSAHIAVNASTPACTHIVHNIL